MTVIASEGSYSAGEVAAGATLALTPTVSLYGEIGTLWNIGGDADVKSSVQGSLGIKVRRLPHQREELGPASAIDLDGARTRCPCG